MTRIFLILYLFKLSILSSFAQKEYWQQKVDYKINVSLDDIKHTIQGNIEIDYFNNSPDSLDQIYMHVWPNAYKNDKTAFAVQKLHKISRDFYFAKENQKGYITDLDFKVNNQKAQWSFDKMHEDIILIKLSNKLAPGKKLTISTPFYVQIPHVFSRMGHNNQDYYMTQWYPKPAVYDKSGWHPIPYLDMGEFYSEFGDFEVNITLPSNYIVGATGVLQNETDKKYLEERISLTKKLEDKLIESSSFIGKPSAQELKTVSFKAEKVHDFAWFASKDFLVSKDVAVLSRDKIPTYGYYTVGSAKTWNKSAFYVKRAVEYYSERIGDYPWPQASAVFGDLEAGGGMEYPMITIINVKENAKSVDEVITHEVGHNWFYGIIASNERDNAWMDEGLNTFYEDAYMDTYYNSSNSKDKLSLGSVDLTSSMIGKYFHLRKLDQPLNLTSNEFAPINYGLDVYYKTARYFKVLEEFVGKKEFDKAMKSYFNKWSFRHPTPKDLKAVLEPELKKDLTWLFDNLIKKNQMVDYKLKLFAGTFLLVENKTNNPVPVPISLYKNNEFLGTKWAEGAKGDFDIKIDLMQADKIIIDEKDLIYDINKCNNYYSEKGLFHYKRPLKLRIGGLFEDSKNSYLNILPVIGWNNSDKTMLGLGIYSTPFPGHPFRYYVLPMYAFGSKKLVGQAWVEQNFYSYSSIERFSIGVFGKTYTNNTADFPDRRYIKVAPYISIEMARWKNWAHKLTYTPNFLIKEKKEFTIEGDPIINPQSYLSLIHTLDYEISNSNRAVHNEAWFRLEQQSYNSLLKSNVHYLKLTLDWRTKFYYSIKKSVDVRLFAGGFLYNSKRKSSAYNDEDYVRGSMSLASTGPDDYLYEGAYLARTAGSGLFSRQVDITDGGMKFGGAFYNKFGYSNSFLTSINLKAGLPFDLPLKLPLKPYFDAGYFHNFASDYTKNIVWSGGMMFDFWNIFGFYFPLINSQNLEDQYKRTYGNEYLKRITFSIQLPVIRITEVLKHINLN